MTSQSIPKDRGEGGEHDKLRQVVRDSALASRIRTGDIEAFRTLVDLYIEPLTRFASSIAGPLDVAEDITQRVFIHVWEHRETVDPARSIRAYLYQAVRNECLKEQRFLDVRTRHRDTIQAEADAGSIQGTVPSFESVTIAKVSVDAAIEQLPPRRGQAIRLRYEEELSYGEIGEVMGISEAAAMQLTLRALDDLRKIFRVRF